MTEAREMQLGAAFDLLAAYEREAGFFMERNGLGVGARGEALRIVVPAGEEQVVRGVASVTAAITSIARQGGAVPVAAGAFPFDGGRDAVIVVPELIARRTEPERTRLVTLGRNGSDEANELEFERVAAGATPHQAFGEVQLLGVPGPDAYGYAVADALDRIHTTQLTKVVLARTIEVDAGRDLDPRRLAHRLRAVDPSCYAFAASSGPGRVLVGATPELLIRRRGLELRSNPLAGSAPRSGDLDEDRESALALGSSPKERQEHAIVVETVFRALHPFCDELRFDREPQLLATANVWHLSTRFRGRLKDPAPSALELAATLHPTPAVCGEPRAAARALIDRLEPFDRGCYAGPVGWVDANGDGEWAIALRCAELEGAHATLYAGAGIVADSDPESEVEETERKFRAFLDSLRWG